MSAEKERTKTNAIRRTHRTRSSIHGTAERPRLSVSISNRHITAQIIDDDTATTLLYGTTVHTKASGSLADKAAVLGTTIGKAAAKRKIARVVLDRRSAIYAKRLHAFAEAARKEGLEF